MKKENYAPVNAAKDTVGGYQIGIEILSKVYDTIFRRELEPWYDVRSQLEGYKIIEDVHEPYIEQGLSQHVVLGHDVHNSENKNNQYAYQSQGSIRANTPTHLRLRRNGLRFMPS